MVRTPPQLFVFWGAAVIDQQTYEGVLVMADLALDGGLDGLALALQGRTRSTLAYTADYARSVSGSARGPADSSTGRSETRSRFFQGTCSLTCTARRVCVSSWRRTWK